MNDRSGEFKRTATSQYEQFRRLLAEHEVAMIELREARDDADSTAEAVNLLQRIRRGEA